MMENSKKRESGGSDPVFNDHDDIGLARAGLPSHQGSWGILAIEDHVPGLKRKGERKKNAMRERDGLGN